MTTEFYEIKTQSSNSKIRLLDFEATLCERVQVYRKSRQVDSFGPFWFLIMGDFQEGSVAVRSGAEWVRLQGPVAVFVPAFQIVQWQLKPGPLEWKSISSPCHPRFGYFRFAYPRKEGIGQRGFRGPRFRCEGERSNGFPPWRPHRS